jgi:hypothetical protein
MRQDSRLLGGPGSAQHAVARPAYLYTQSCTKNARTCRVECVRCRARAGPGQDHPSGTGIIEPNEQLIYPPFPCHRLPASGHPLRDLQAHRGLPSRHSQRGANRPLPPGPSRSARPVRKVRVRIPPPVPSPASSPGPGASQALERRRTRSAAISDESPRAYPPDSGVRSG